MKSASRKFIRSLAAPALVAGALIASGQAMAQNNAAVTRLRGTITAISGDTVKVHTRDGKDVSVDLSKDTQIRGVALDKVTDIKAGSYIGTAAMPMPDGTLKALEVHVFPPSMRGSGEGHRPWDLGSHSSMTNGTVGDVVVSNGHTITVNYSNGEQKIVVPDNVPVVSLSPGDRSLLAPGVKVVLFAHQNGSGGMVADAVSAGENGVTPPM